MHLEHLKAPALTLGSGAPWNKGALVGSKPPLKPKQVWSIRLGLQRQGRTRDLALFDLAIDSKLRGCDLVALRIADVVINATPRHRAIVIQRKTGRPVQFELTEQTRDSLLAWLTARGGGMQVCVPQPREARSSSGNASVCPPRRRLDRGNWSGPSRLRHPQPATDQGGADLQADGQSPGGADPPRTYEAREHRPLPWRRDGRRLGAVGGDGDLTLPANTRLGDQSARGGLPRRGQPGAQLGRSAELGIFQKADTVDAASAAPTLNIASSTSRSLPMRFTRCNR